LAPTSIIGGPGNPNIVEHARQRPAAQLDVARHDFPHAPQFAGSNDEQQLRQDRRTFLTGLQLGGR